MNKMLKLNYIGQFFLTNLTKNDLSYLNNIIDYCK